MKNLSPENLRTIQEFIRIHEVIRLSPELMAVTWIADKDRKYRWPSPIPLCVIQFVCYFASLDEGSSFDFNNRSPFDGYGRAIACRSFNIPVIEFVPFRLYDKAGSLDLPPDEREQPIEDDLWKVFVHGRQTGDEFIYSAKPYRVLSNLDPDEYFAIVPDGTVDFDR